MTSAHSEQKRNKMISPSSAAAVEDQSPPPPSDQLDNQCRNQSDVIIRRESKRKWWLKTRVHVALLGLTIAAVNCYAQATFCIAIVEMVLPADYKSDSTPLEGANEVKDPFNRDQSCPIEYKYRDYYDSWRFSSTTPSGLAQWNASNTSNHSTKPAAKVASSQTIDVSNRFDWDASQQGLLLGAFAVGTAPLQIAGGRLAEMYGSKWVLLMGCVGTGLTNLAIPYLAHFSFLLLLVDRVVMGVAQAGMEPGLMCLLADWLTPQEAGFFISMLLFAICMGFFLGSLCSSFILGLSYGWPLTYYVSGGLNLLVALIWYIYADSWPRASKYISEEELRFIEHGQGAPRQQQPLAVTIESTQDLIRNNPESITSGGRANEITSKCQTRLETSKIGSAIVNDPLGAPWLNILSSRPVWAFIICKISIRWCADVLSNELPTYLANVLHLSIKINGLLNSVSTALFAISSFVTGWLATSELCLGAGETTSTSNRSKTRIRKSFQSLASFGSALCLILMTQFDCDLLVSMSMLLVLSCCLVMGTGGELQIPYDMTSRYPGTLHGLACTLSVSGWLAPPLIGLILGDQPSSRSRWSVVWHSTAAINLLGGLIFLLFADASPRDFDQPKSLRRNRKCSSKDKNLEAQDVGGESDLKNSHREDLGYINDGLHNSSCESSPKSSHHQHQQQNQVRAGDGKALNPLDASVTFDCGKLIKCRQFESSFIQPETFRINSYLRDSPLQQDPKDLIHPYREQHVIDCFASARKQTASSRVQAHESKKRSPWWHQWRLFASKKRPSAPPAPLTIRATPPSNEKSMPNEPTVTTNIITSETINHLRISHDKVNGIGRTATASNQLVDKLCDANDVHAFHPDTNHADAVYNESNNSFKNAAATATRPEISHDRYAGSDDPSTSEVTTNFVNHDHPGDGRAPPNDNEFELNPNSLLTEASRRNDTLTRL